jgi:hypothetical protein
MRVRYRRPRRWYYRPVPPWLILTLAGIMVALAILQVRL